MTDTPHQNAAALLARLDRALDEIFAVRAELANVAAPPSEDAGDPADDWLPKNLLEPSTVAERLGIHPATVRRYIGSPYNCGKRRSPGRYWVSLPKLKRLLDL